jgi:hypothetical protein
MHDTDHGISPAHLSYQYIAAFASYKSDIATYANFFCNSCCRVIFVTLARPNNEIRDPLYGTIGTRPENLRPVCIKKSRAVSPSPNALTIFATAPIYTYGHRCKTV